MAETLQAGRSKGKEADSQNERPDVTDIILLFQQGLIFAVPSKMCNVIFHIGLHKTATTTLQEQVFSHWHPDDHRSTDCIIKKYVRAVTTCDPIYFDAANWRELISSRITSAGPTLISRESLSGALYAGIGKRGLDHRSAILKNMISTFPKSRVILVLRRQDSLARSLYRQYLKVGGTESIDVFYGIGGKRSPILSLDRFRFSPYIDYLVSLFSSGVLILTFEEFVARPHEFLRKLSNFVEVDCPSVQLSRSNRTRLGSFGMEVSRRINRLSRSRLNPAGLMPLFPIYRGGRFRLVTVGSIIHNNWPGSGNIKEDSKVYRVCEEIFDSVKADNRLVDQRYQLGLDIHGYY